MLRKHNSTFEFTKYRVAWFSEFKVTTENIKQFLDGFHAFAAERGKAVFVISKPELTAFLLDRTKLDTLTLMSCLDIFLLKHRPKWDASPPNFSSTAWLPWRFRRRLSLISKPIVQLEDGETARFVIAPAMIVHHVAKFVSDLRSGNFDEKEFSRTGEMSRWIGKINHSEGEAFNQRVADRFISLGWKAQANLTDGEILRRAADTRFGDVDVLAWSEGNQRVLVVECKDLSFDKTLGEIARRLARYRGKVDNRGERDDLKKHLDRCDVLANALSRVSEYVGFEVRNIEKVLVFSQPTPMLFDETLAEHNVDMLTIKHIPEWVKKPATRLKEAISAP